MPLDRTDYTKILQHLREAVRDALGPVDDRIMADFGWEDDPRGNLFRYMSMLGELVGLGARGEAEKVMAIVREHISVSEGNALSEVRVLLTPAEQEQYRAEYLSLAGSPELDQLLADLRRLRSELLEEGGDLPRQS